LKDCQVLFVSSSEAPRVDRIIASCGTNSILTVGEGEQFTRRGGMIGFMISDQKVRFRINREAAEGAGLTVSSRLLRLSVDASPPLSR
jgi:N-acetylglucosamine kinase-like BadF-type ATPase